MTNDKMAGNRAAFRQRCQQALLHPVTLGALGLLLLNDLVLKGLWPNPWTTGKLSDLAWVVFASPLLAYLLSLAAPGGRRAQRAIWIAAYIGLPALYAAYNTFAPLHDAILRAMSLISGGSGGSPLDATDSLVIPLGLAIALWVWRRGRTTLTIRRRHIAMAVAGLAVFAAIASQGPPPMDGVIRFETTDEGRLAAYCNDGYETIDGGFTWQPSSHYVNSYRERLSFFTRDDGLRDIFTSQGQYILNEYGTVATPRGDYAINKRGVTHTVITSQLVYPMEYLRSSSAQWIQERDASQLWPSPGYDVHIATAPYDITYDAPSDNVIVALGIQGIVVGTSDGKWTRVAVGSCRPTDFSFSGKTLMLLGNNGLRIAILSLPISIIALAVFVAAMRIHIANGSLGRTVPTIATPILAVIIMLHTGLALVGLPESFSADSLRIFILAAFMVIGAVPALITFALCVGWFANLKSLFGYSAVAALALAAQITLALLVWINSDFSPWFVKISVVVMAVLTGYALQHYLNRKERGARAAPPPASAADSGR